MVPCDFIAPAITHNPLSDHHQKLLSNFFAQTEATAFGKSREVVEQEYRDQGKDPATTEHVVPFKVFEGNRPTNSILLREITPFSLGALIALYEHKIFTRARSSTSSPLTSGALSWANSWLTASCRS